MAAKKPPDPLLGHRGGGTSLSSPLPLDRANGLQGKMDEMKDHISKLKKELEAERMAVKRLKREKVSELRNVRSEEQRKSAGALATLRRKLESDKMKEMENLREMLMKQMYAERNKLLKERDVSAKSQEEQQRREMDAALQKTKNQYLLEAKEEARKLHEAEQTRFLNETAELRSIKKKLETDLEHLDAANRQYGSELRRDAEEHGREMDLIKKEARRDIIHLVEELKAKQRLICELEKELGQQAGYALKLQAEKDTLGQELNLAKMADMWERRSQTTSRSASSGGLSMDSNKNENGRSRIASPLSPSGIPVLVSRDSPPLHSRPELSTKAKRVDAPLIKAKSPVSRIPTLSSSQSRLKTPSPVIKDDKSVRRRTMSPLIPTTEKKLRMSSSPLTNQGAGMSTSSSSLHEGDGPSTTPTHTASPHSPTPRTATPISMASSELEGEDLEIQDLISSSDAHAFGWLKEKQSLEEQVQNLKARLSEVEEAKSKLNWSLRESQDQNDLLEFRVLELEESRKEQDENEPTQGASSTSIEQLNPVEQAKESSATQIASLPDKPNPTWDAISHERLNYTHIPELKQKLDQLTGEENSSANADQRVLLSSISKVLQSAQENIIKLEDSHHDMQQRLMALEEENKQLEKQTKKQKEDNQILHQNNKDLSESLSKMEAEASSYEALATEMDKLRIENDKMRKEIADNMASKEADESFKERIRELEALLEQQSSHIEKLCNNHSHVVSELVEKHQGHVRQLESAQKERENELDRVEGLHPYSYQYDRRRSSAMETETEKTDSELQRESLWEAIEATKSSETDSQLNFLQDQSDHENSVVEELFQVLEKGAEKATPDGSIAMDNVPKKEDDDGDTVADDVDTDSSFSLPLPDDEVDDDDDDGSDDEPPRRKLPVPELFRDGNSVFGWDSKPEFKDDDIPLEDLAEADAAAITFSNPELDGKPMQQDAEEPPKDTGKSSPGVDGATDDSSDDENDKEWNESEVLQRLGAEDKTTSTKEATDGTDFAEYGKMNDDQDEDTQTDFSDLVSQNEELKCQVQEKEMKIQEMKDTARTLKQVIRDQMAESEKLRGADESPRLERKLGESKMKEDMLKRVVKDLQVSEQSLKEQLNQLIEERDELKNQLKIFEEKLNQENNGEVSLDNINQRCKDAEERVMELEKLNISMMEKYETEIAEKDIRCEALEREKEELTRIAEMRDELQLKLSKSEENINEKEEMISSLKHHLAKNKEKEESDHVERDEMSFKIQEMEVSIGKVQEEFARKCSEAIQLQAQIKLLEERMVEDENKSSQIILKMEQSLEAKEKEARDVLDNTVREKDKLIEELLRKHEDAQESLKVERGEHAIKDKIAKEKEESDMLESMIDEKDKEISNLKTQLEQLEDKFNATTLELDSQSEKFKEQEEEIEHALGEVVAEKDKEISELQSQLTNANDTLKEILQESEKQILDAVQSKMESDEELSKLQKQLVENQKDVSRVEEKADEEISTKVAEVAEAKASYHLLQEKYEAEHLEKEKIMRAHTQIQEELMTAQANVKKLEEQRSHLKKLLSEMKSEVEFLNAENMVLDEKLSEYDERSAEIESKSDPVVCEDAIVAQVEHTTEAVPVQSSNDIQKDENFLSQLKEKEEEILRLESLVRDLQDEKISMEERMKGIEELLKDSVIDNEDMLRERITELEMAEKTLKRKVQEMESAQKDAEEKLDDALEEMKHMEESYENRFKEVRASEQVQLEKAAELEEIGNHWKNEIELLKEQVENSESINQNLKTKLQEVETELEELQVSSKLAGDELGGTQKSLPSLLDEGLGALDTGRTGTSHFADEYEDDEDDVEDDYFVFKDDLPQESEIQKTNPNKKDLHRRIEELEKSEAELMEKVEFLQQSESELAELLDSLQQNEAVVREASEQLEEMRAHNLEVEQSLEKALKDNQDLQEKIAELEIEKDEVTMKLDEEIDKDEYLQQLQKDLEKAAQTKLDLEFEIKELETAKGSSIASYKELEDAHNETIKLKDGIEKELQESQAAYREIAQKLAVIETPNSSFLSPEGIIKLEEENHEMAKQLQETEEEKADFIKKMKALEADIEFLEELKAGGEQSIAELSFQVETLEGEVASKSRMLEENESILEDRQSEAKELRRELEEKMEMYAELEALNDQLKADYMVKYKMIEDNAKIMEKKVAELDATRQELSIINATCNDLRAKLSELENIVEVLRKEKDALMTGRNVRPVVEEEMVVCDAQQMDMMALPPPLPSSLPPPLHSHLADNNDDDSDSPDISERIETAPTIEALQLRIQHLVDNEEKLQEKINELEQRQSAFQETLAAADNIMTERENEFKDEISELESSNKDLKQMLLEARMQGQESRRSSEVPSLTKSEEDYSIFDCIDEDDEEESECDVEDELNDESEKPKGEASIARRSSTPVRKLQRKLKRVASDDTLTLSQEKIADLMLKVDELEKQNSELQLALQEKEKHLDESGNQSHSSSDRDRIQQEKVKLEEEMKLLKDKVDAFKPFEDQFKHFLEEKDLSEADRHASHSPADEIMTLRQKILELESSHEDLKEELRDTKLSEETLTEISEEQVKEIQRLKDDVAEARSKQLKDKKKSSESFDVSKAEVDDMKNKLSAVVTENQEYENKLSILNDELQEMKKTRDKLEDEVDVLTAHVEELGNSESKLKDDLQASEKSHDNLKQSNEQLGRTVKALEESIEMLTSRVQESDQSQERAKSSNKILESKFKDMLMNEGILKKNLKQLETAKKELEQKVGNLERADERWKGEMQEMEEAILETKRHSRKLEEEVKILKLDNGQLEHEKDILTEKVEERKSQDVQTQNRLSEMEIEDSNLRLQLKNCEMREGNLKEQLKDLENVVATLKQKVSKTNQLEGDYDALQRELQAAVQRADDYERSNVKLQEKLTQLEENLRSHGMVSLSVSEYQELKAQATLATLADREPRGAKEGGVVGAAGEVWMRLDQKNKELREVQELYNQSVKESVKLKQSLRDLQAKGGQSIHIQTKNVAGGEGEVKSTQTIPLKLMTREALQTRILTDDGDTCITLEDFLTALPPQGSAPSSTIPIKVYGPLIQTDKDLIQIDQSVPSYMHRQPIREQPIGEEMETVTMAMRPVVDDDVDDFDGLGLEVDEIDRLRVGLSVSDEIDMSVSSDAPPLPETSPPGQLKRHHIRTSSTSSDLSDLAPPPPPLPSLPPPPKHGGGGDYGAEQLLFTSSQATHLRAPSFDSGMETQEPEMESSISQDLQTGPPQLRLPTVPGSGTGPPVAPKPGTPLWLKKMVDWQNAEKGKEHGEYMRTKERVDQLARTNKMLEDELRELRVDREHMKRQVQGASDARELQQKLQSRELELEDKERQVMRLKTEIKEREMEVVRLKSQLEAFSEAGKTSHSDEMNIWRLRDQLERTQEQLREKEHLIHSHDATLGRVKADLVKKETELLAKENALQLKKDELAMVKERMRLMEEGQRDDTTKIQLSQYSSKLTTLSAENESLRARLSELEPLEMQVGELRVELSRSTHSTRSTEALEKKLQMAQKMLHEKTENEMRLAEDNASLQQRLRTTQTQDAYTKGLEKECTKLQDEMGTLEHERNEAELAVAPLKAKVSYLTKKCQERDDLIRKLKQEMVLSKSDKSSDLLEQIGNLSTLLPDEEYNVPLKSRSRSSRQNRLNSGSPKKNRAKLPDLSDLLNDDEKEFLKRESLENADVLSDLGQDEGEISLQELMKQTNHRHGIRNDFEDITLDELDILGTAGETGSDHISVGTDIGLSSRDRKRRSPVSFGFGSVPTSFKSRAVKDRQPRPTVLIPSSNHTSPRSVGIDLPDGLIAAPLANPQTDPISATTYTSQQQHQAGLPPPPPSVPHGYPHRKPVIPQNHLPAEQGTVAPARITAPPVQGVQQVQHPSNIPYTDIPTPSQYLSHGLPLQASQAVPQILNNTVPRPQPNGYPSSNTQQSVPASMYGLGQAPSVGQSLPLSHQNVLNLPGSQQNVNGVYQGSNYTANQGLNTGIPDPPTSLSIAREVSKHSVLLTWNLPSMDVMSRSNGAEIVGYRIYVNGQQKQLVSSAHMTKALVDGIYLKTIYRFGICTVSASGLTSSMAELSYIPASSVPSTTGSESGKTESVISSDVPSDRKHGHREERLFMAVYSYDPESHSPNDNPEYELSFTEGDMITVYGERRPDGFYHGKVRGRKGLVPSNFIEEISKAEYRKRIYGSQESRSRRSRESSADGRRRRESSADRRKRREKRGRSERETRRREGQSHRGHRV